VSDPLPLEFRLSPPPGPYGAVRGLYAVGPEVAPSVRRAVLARDLDCCRFCGFQSAKHQQAVALADDLRDVAALATACVFCEQVACVDTVPSRRSGVLVWLPEVGQAELNAVARVLYVCRVRQDELAARARALLDKIVDRRPKAETAFGSADAAVLAKRLRTEAEGKAGAGSLGRDWMARGLRLFPLDRRLVTEGELQYNQFPQVLDFWRSRNGPLRPEVAPEALAAAEEKLAVIA